MLLQIISYVVSLLIFYVIIELFKSIKRKNKLQKLKNIDYKTFHSYEQTAQHEVFDPKKHDPSDFVGRRPNTKFEQRKIDAQMKAFLESNPNHSFWKDHPEYLEKYLNDVDLSELNL